MAEEAKVVQQQEEVKQEVKSETRHDSPRGKRPFNKNGRRPLREKKQDEFEDRTVAVNRVVKTVKGGRKLRFASLIVAGDKKGRVGMGTGKAKEVPDGIKKAAERARKNTIVVPMVKGNTIPHTIVGRHGACRVFLRPAPAGTGVIAGGPVRAVVELAGIENIVSKSLGSSTPINIVRATIEGLATLRTAEQVAEIRGKKAEEIVG